MVLSHEEMIKPLSVKLSPKATMLVYAQLDRALIYGAARICEDKREISEDRMRGPIFARIGVRASSMISRVTPIDEIRRR